MGESWNIFFFLFIPEIQRCGWIKGKEEKKEEEEEDKHPGQSHEREIGKVPPPTTLHSIHYTG